MVVTCAATSPDLGNRICVNHQAAADGTRDLTAADWNAAEILGAVIIGDEVNELAIRREARLGGDAVQASA